MDLSTQYLGFKLPHPLIAGASPLSRNLDTVRRLEDSGVAAIVLYSLFEEQVLDEQLATTSAIDGSSNASPEAADYLPTSPDVATGPEDYLEQLRRVKAAVSVPVIGSINGTSIGGWLEYAKLISEAGADALELNTYDMATDPSLRSETIERQMIDLVRIVRKNVDIPVAVKLSPFYTSLPNFAARLVEAGANALVVFNRFYQPDIDIANLQVVRVNLSDSSELLLRLHALAILSGQIDCDLGVTGGVHTAIDVIKSVMAGADGVQMVSSLLRNGPEHLSTVRDQVAQWLEASEYESLAQARGSMNLLRCPDPHLYQRANYIQLLNSYKV